MSDETMAAGDTSAEHLIRAAIPLLDKLIGMWVVGKDDKKLARAMRDALTSSEGIEIAGRIAKYYNPYGEDKTIAAGATLSGVVEWAGIAPGEGKLTLFIGDGVCEIGPETDMTNTHDPAGLAELLLENPYTATVTAGEDGVAARAEFTRLEKAP